MMVFLEDIILYMMTFIRSILMPLTIVVREVLNIHLADVIVIAGMKAGANQAN